MKIAIIGSGAIGCLYGAYLSKSNDVYMICRRQQTSDSIKRDGLTLYEPDKTCQVYKNVRAFVSGECREIMDLVIIIVKTSDTRASIESNMAMIGENTLVMTLQNGGGNDEKLSEFVPMDRIILGTTRHNSVNLGNGMVRHSGSGETYIGGNVDSKGLSAVADAFNESGIETIVSDDIARIIWSKLFVNLSINTFTAITKAPIGFLIDNDYSWFYPEKLIREAIDIAAAEGISFDPDEVLSQLRGICEKVATGFSSMSQDVMNARLTEVDSINGYVVERGKAHGISVAYNEFVVNLIHAIEHSYKMQTRILKKFKIDEIVLQQGAANSCLYRVLQGSVACYMYFGTDKEYLVSVCGVGHCFGEYSAMSGNPNPYTVVANEDTIILEIPKSDIHNYLAMNPKNSMDVIKSMSRQIAVATKHIELLLDS